MKREPCPHCNSNNWRAQPILGLVNPNGEFVVGYGHSQVYKQIETEFYCNGCGWKEGGNPTIINMDGKEVKA